MCDQPRLPINRRRFLRNAAGAGALVAAPAIIGRAGIASAQAAFAGEELIVVA